MVKRYDLELYHTGGGWMVENEEGDYVKHENYAALEAERDRLIVDFAPLEYIFSRLQRDEANGQWVISNLDIAKDAKVKDRVARKAKEG